MLLMCCQVTRLQHFQNAPLAVSLLHQVCFQPFCFPIKFTTGFGRLKDRWFLRWWLTAIVVSREALFRGEEVVECSSSVWSFEILPVKTEYWTLRSVVGRQAGVWKRRVCFSGEWAGRWASGKSMFAKRITKPECCCCTSQALGLRLHMR